MGTCVAANRDTWCFVLLLPAGAVH